MRNRTNYQRAVSYAFKCNPVLSRDIVHDAYIARYNGHGDNLFDQDIFVILRYVKNVWLFYTQQMSFQYKGVKYRKQWFSLSGSTNDQEGPTKSDPWYTPKDTVTPEDHFISAEQYKLLYGKIENYNSGNPSTLSVDDLKIYLDLRMQGYNQKEISKILETSPQRVNYWNKRLQSICCPQKQKED